MVWFDPLNLLFRSSRLAKTAHRRAGRFSPGRTICQSLGESDYRRCLLNDATAAILIIKIPPKQTICYKLNAFTAFGKPQRDPSSLQQ